jgi:predicted RNA-binding protein YlxR (DUF448 family)
VRVTVPDGVVVAGCVVVGGPSAGRGAWLCRADGPTGPPNPDCVELALRRGGFARAWRRRLDDDERRAIRDALR